VAGGKKTYVSARMKKRRGGEGGDVLPGHMAKKRKRRGPRGVKLEGKKEEGFLALFPLPGQNAPVPRAPAREKKKSRLRPPTEGVKRPTKGKNRLSVLEKKKKEGEEKDQGSPGLQRRRKYPPFAGGKKRASI